MKPAGLVLAALAGLALSARADDPAPVPDKTPLTVYRCYVHDTLSPRWYGEMERNKTGLRYGKVKLRFTVHADGSVSNIVVLVGDSSDLLKTVTIQVLLATAPFKPFSAELVREMGKSYVDEMTFEITRPHAIVTAEDAKHRYAVPPSD